MEDHAAALVLSVQGGDGDGTLAYQEFVSSLPLFCSTALRARVSVVLEMRSAAQSPFCSGCIDAIDVTLGAGLVFCTGWVL